MRAIRFVVVGLLVLAAHLLWSTRVDAAGLPDLDAWVGDGLADSDRKAIEDAFVEEEAFLAGKAWVARPSAEAFRRMSELAKTAPRSAAHQAYLAHAATYAGDFAAAEAAWKETVTLTGGAPWAIAALAEHHRQRLQPEKALAALEDLADAWRRKQAAGDPDARARLRGVYQQALDLTSIHGVGDAKRWRRALAGLFPEDPSYLRVWLQELSDDPTVTLSELRAEVSHFRKAFPAETRLFTRVEANMLHRAGKTDDAVALWRAVLAPNAAIQVDDAREDEARWRDFFDLLHQAGRLEAETAALDDRARAGSLTPVELVELFYLRWPGETARTLLDDARGRWAPATDAETLLRARLHARAGDGTQAVRYYYAAAAAAKNDAVREAATVELAELLLAGAPRAAVTPLDPSDAFAPDRLATGPSIPGGLASLVFQGSPTALGADLDRQITAWQNGVRAETVFDQARAAWPKSRRVARLSMGLISWYRTYGFHEAVVVAAARHVKAWPDGAEAVQAQLAAADAERARGNKEASDKLWRDALLRAERRSAEEGERVFDAWGRVLLSEKRGLEVVKLYWERIERSPRDARLYERMLGFLGQVQLYDEELRVYEKALERFGDASWTHRIARWHVRHRGEKAFRDLTDRLMKTFSGTEAEVYLAALVQDDYAKTATDRSRYYEAIYKMALGRFPHRLGLVRALIDHYDQHAKRGKDALALTARYAPVSPELMESLLHRLGQARDLDPTLKAVAKPRGRAEKLLRVELLVRLSRQEDALAPVAELAADWPDDARLALRAAHLTAAVHPKLVGEARAREAATHLDRMTRWNPTATQFADEAGALLAEAGELGEAKKRWEHLVAARRGSPQAYVDLAAALWDWYLFDDAEQAFVRARKKTGDPLLFWDKAGLVQESRRDWSRAAEEYVAAHADEVGRAPLGPVVWPTPSAYYDPEEEQGWGDVYGEQPVVLDPHGGASPPIDLLLELAKRKGGDKAILDAYAVAQRKDPKDFRPALAQVRFLRAADRKAEARRELLAALPRFRDDAFLVAAISDASAENWSDALIAALERRADLGGGEAQLVWPLADALEAAGEHARAEAKLRAVAARADKGTDPVAARLRLSDFLLRHGRIDDAFTERRAAADKATGRRRDEVLLDLGWRAVEAGRLDEGRKLFDDLQARNPRDLRPIEGGAEALTRAGNGDGLRDHYRKAIAGARALTGVTQGEKDALVAELRRSFVVRLERAKLHVDAVDQWIELVNRGAERKDVVLGAFSYARRHKVLDRLVTYYVNAARKSPKDVRWPLVLAWMYEASGKPADAAAAYQAALNIRPERLDLLAAQGGAHVAAGDFAAADKAFERAYRQSDEDVRWLLERARAQAHLGKHDVLRKTLELYVTRAAWMQSARYRNAAEVLAQAGLDDEAYAMHRRALDEAVAAPSAIYYRGDDARALLDAGARAGKAEDAAKRLEQALAAYTAANGKDRGESYVDESNTAAVLDALTVGIVELAGRAVDADARVLLPFAQRQAPKLDSYAVGRLADQLATHGYFTPAADVLAALRDRPKNSQWERKNADSQLLWIMRRAGDDRKVLALAAERATGDDRLAWIATAIEAARGLGDVDEEKAWLGRYWDAIKSKDELSLYELDRRDANVVRYLELLRRAKDRKGLEAVAARGDTAAGQVADWLLAAGEVELAVKTVEAVAKRLDLPRVWATSRLAAGLAAAGEHGTRTHDYFLASLGRRGVGELEGGKLAETDVLVGRAWWALARAYATELAAHPSPNVRLDDYAFSEAEDHPLRASSQLAIAAIYLTRRDWKRAERHGELALVLAPDDRAAWDTIARARLGAGDRDGALKAWENLRKKGDDAAHVAFATALHAAGLKQEARSSIATLIGTRWASLDARTGPPLVDALVAISDGDPKEIHHVLRGYLPRHRHAWGYDKVLGWTVSTVHDERSRDWDEGYGDESYREEATLTPIVAPDVVEVYVKEALALTTTDNTLLRKAWVAYLLGLGRFPKALEAATEALDVHRKTGAKDTPVWIALAFAEAKLEVDPLARTLVEQGSAADLGDAVAMFQRRKRPDLAAKLTLAYHEATDAAPAPGVLLELAAARLALGETDAAVALLEARITAEPASPEAYRQAATVLEAGARPTEARRFRERLAKIDGGDAENRLGLARAALAEGDRAAAIEVAITLLGDRRAARAQRDAAAALVREAANQDVARRAASSIVKRAETQPADAATWVALAHARRAAGDASGADGALDKALEVGLAPRAALLHLGEARLAAGKPADAITLLERAFTHGGTKEVRRALFRARRAAGRHQAGIVALSDELLGAYRSSGAGDQAKAVRADLVSRGAVAFAGELDLVVNAADSAAQAGDWMAAAWFRSVAATLDDKTAKLHHDQATAALQQALVVERRAERQYLRLTAEVPE